MLQKKVNSILNSRVYNRQYKQINQICEPKPQTPNKKMIQIESLVKMMKVAANITDAYVAYIINSDIRYKRRLPENALESLSKPLYKKNERGDTQNRK